MNFEDKVLAAIFNELSNDSLTKLSFVRKLPNHMWGVFSHKNKLLGKYKTKEEANKRLRQIEFFKHKKASKEESTYSSTLRELNKTQDPEIIRQFKAIFKENFDQGLLEDKENPEEDALKAAQSFIDSLEDGVSKVASAIEMGDPVYAGKYIAEIIKFLMRRISHDNRPKSLGSVKNKIYLLNEYEIAGKKMPASSSMGQAITLTKHLLMRHSPEYIRSVLNSIVSAL